MSKVKVVGQAKFDRKKSDETVTSKPKRKGMSSTSTSVSTKPIRAAIYARSAVASQEAVDSQIEVCKQYCEKHSYEVTNDAVFHEFGSANGGRPVLSELFEMACCTPPSFDVIVATDISRISRSNATLLSFLEDLRKVGIVAEFATDGLRSNDAHFQTMIAMHALISANLRKQRKRS